MTKTLSMVSHKNYNLSANEDFVIFLTSKLITCSIDEFTLEMKFYSIVYLLNESEHIIVYRTLKMKCTQYGICGQVTFKNARAMVFSKSGGHATISGRVLKILIFWTGDCLSRIFPPP